LTSISFLFANEIVTLIVKNADNKKYFFKIIYLKNEIKENALLKMLMQKILISFLSLKIKK
jgi:hypothetical protein